MTRRQGLGALLAVILAATHPPGDARAGGKEGGVFAIEGETFVGRTSDPDVFVAVVLGADHATAYVCDGAMFGIAFWFYGQVIRDEIDFVTVEGDRLVGVLSDQGMSGRVILHAGRSLNCAAQRATGAAGLYFLRLLADGRIHGESSTGSVLEGEELQARSGWESLPVPSAPADWRLLGLSSQQAFDAGVTFTARITLPDTRTIPAGVWTISVVPDRFWVILLADGDARGRGIAMAIGA
jgi:hypothetical protein